ncbi:MAG: hypothetical protein K0R39_4533 [Symbiobacteriaceae bacterium]|jgi:hypothetical protein|nr:hypothetical protein [Symbiobacteriaceae bacterium]
MVPLRAGRATWKLGTGGVLIGVLLAVVLHLLQVLLKHALPQPSLAYVGLSQWLYLVPAAWGADRIGYPMVRRGVLIAGLVGSGLNLIAYGVIYYLFFVPSTRG